MNMESISMSGRVAPVAKSPLDSARGRSRRHGIICVTHQDILEQINEYIRELQVQNTLKMTILLK